MHHAPRIRWSDAHLWPEQNRWFVSSAAVLLVYAVIGALLVRKQDLASADAGSPVVLVEMASLPAAPTSSNLDLAPGILQPQRQSEARQREEAKSEPPPPPQDTVPELPVNPQAPVQIEQALPKPREEQPAPKPVEQQPTPEVAAPTAPPRAEVVAPTPAGPALDTQPQSASQTVQTWQRSLAAKLQQSKRYPANARGEKGTARVSFTIDRSGRVVTANLAVSSGSAAVDEEAVALVRRAEPLPKPPDDATAAQLTFTFPFNLVRSR